MFPESDETQAARNLADALLKFIHVVERGMAVRLARLQPTSTSVEVRPAAKASAEYDDLMDIRAVGEFLKCSRRHVFRLAEIGAIPAPLKLGRLVRWQRKALLAALTAQAANVEERPKPVESTRVSCKSVAPV